MSSNKGFSYITCVSVFVYISVRHIDKIKKYSPRTNCVLYLRLLMAKQSFFCLLSFQIKYLIDVFN